MKLFVASTPFHVFNAVNITENLLKGQKVDLYVLDYNDKTIDIYNKLKNHKGIFNQVYLLEVKKKYCFAAKNKFDAGVNSVKKLLNAASYKSFEGYIPNKQDSYSEIFLAGPDLPSQLVYYYFYSKNHSLQLNLYEEGVYTYNVFSGKRSPARVLTSKAFFGFYYLDRCQRVYLYKPELMTIMPPNAHKVVIPPVNNENRELVRLYEEILSEGHHNKMGIEEDFLYLDSAFYSERDSHIQQGLVSDIKAIIGQEQLAVKLHPRTPKGAYGASVKEICDLGSMELVSLKQSLEHKVLISIISTAAISPKLIFNQEPYVVLLYKLFEKQGASFSFDLDFFHRVKKLYTGEKFFIPESLQELQDIVTFIKEDISNRQAGDSYEQ